jgi:hypothetical protein
MLVNLSLLNLIGGLLRLPSDSFWFYGMVGAGLLALVISYQLAPTDTRKYLMDFKKFESSSKAKKRKWALLTFLVVTGIWAVFICSLVYYLRSLTH